MNDEPARGETATAATPVVERRSLSPEEYRRAQADIMAIHERVLGIPIAELLDQISHSHAVAPILDPTLYMRGMSKLQIIEDIARSLVEFQGVAAKAAGQLLVAQNGVPEGMKRGEAEAAATDMIVQMAEARWTLGDKA